MIEIVVSDTIEKAIQAQKDMYTPEEYEMIRDMFDAACEAEERWGVGYLEDISRPGECPLCSGEAQVQGFAGGKTHMKCRQCGIWCSRDTEPEPDHPFV
jgi:hypothetical protein